MQLLIRTGVRRPGCCSSCPSHEGAGRVSSAVGSACADLRQLLRVFTRPVIGRFSRLGLRSSRAHLTACAPGALAPSPRRRFHRAGRLSDALPGPSGSISPEAMHSKFASPRNRVRVCGDLPAGPRSSRDWLPRRNSKDTPPKMGLSLSRRLERHVDQRPSILSLGRLQDLPLEERVQYRSGLGGVG